MLLLIVGVFHGLQIKEEDSIYRQIWMLGLVESQNEVLLVMKGHWMLLL